MNCVADKTLCMYLLACRQLACSTLGKCTLLGVAHCIIKINQVNMRHRNKHDACQFVSRCAYLEIISQLGMS